MVAYEFIITWSDGSETQRSLDPAEIFLQGSDTLKDDIKDVIERTYNERPADVWVCLHRCAVGLADQSDNSLKTNCNHFSEFVEAGMLKGVSPSSNDPQIPQRWEYTNPSEDHSP
jgi:hypothetical protein